MKEQPYPAISISAIAKKAGISRMGFYRNYDSKDAVLRDYFNHYIGPFYDELNALPKKDPAVISEAYFTYVAHNSALFEVLIESGAETILSQQFTKLVSQFYLTNVQTIPFEGDYARYWNSFVAAGLYNMTIDWIKDGRQAPISLMAEIARKVAG